MERSIRSLHCFRPALGIIVLLVLGAQSFAQRTLIDIIVAQNIKSELQPKLDRLATDLRNEGYTARITSWSAGRSAGDVWKHLRDAYDNNNLQGALLIGHIPAPVMKNDDGQYPRNADMPYWKMVGTTIDLRGKIRTWNIWISRFYSDRSEVERLGNALDANHAYRTGKSRLAHKAYTSVGDDWGGIAQARDNAQQALDLWPASEAVVTPGEAVWSKGGDFLEELQHGNEKQYSDVSISSLFQRGCNIRFIFNNSCHSGKIGGVVNAQILVPGGYNIFSIGSTRPGQGYHLFNMYTGNTCRHYLRAGEPWARAMLTSPPFHQESYQNASFTVIYGDLSMPPMMYPEVDNLPGRPGSPHPAFDEHVIDMNTPLQWASRVGTQSHDVYFGTDSTLDGGDFKGNYTVNSYDPGTLSPGTTYYWSVDAKNASGTTRGIVWRFTTDDGHEKLLVEGFTMPRSATKNMVAGVKFCIDKPIRISEILVDNLLVGSHNNVAIWREVDTDDPLHVFSVTTGTTRSIVSCPADIVLPGGRYVIAALFKEYSFDRVEDIRIADGIEIIHPVNEETSTLTYPTGGYTADEPGRRRIYGHVNFRFSFVDAPVGPPGKATKPSPSNQATDVVIDTVLSWSAGNGTTTHTVYFGTDDTPDADEKHGTQTATVFDPGPLRKGATYYWRINEVNEHGTTTGDVWSFTTADDAVGRSAVSALATRAPHLACSGGSIVLHSGSGAGLPGSVTIVDMRGRTILQRRFERTPAVGAISLPAKANGTYIVKVLLGGLYLDRVMSVVE